ncbi:MAG TPA: hypothetical protein VGZ29_08000 [Terriglobia bacterium]|nr:hypothetical protein [Terriglobia bacterium]
MNSFSGAGPHLRSAAADIVRSLRENPGVSIAAQTSEQFAQALRLYGERPDKSWSLTDCASFLIMDAAGIDAALTQDQHFAQAGYEVVLR